MDQFFAHYDAFIGRLADAGLQLRRVIVPTGSPLFPLRLVEASL